MCLNCGAALAGPFCSQCGQRVVPPHPTTRELVGDAYDEMVGWDGKFARTTRLLLRHPGELTRAVIGGQRAHYVSAVRLYLMCSVLYFLIRAAAPIPDTDVTVDIGFGVGASTSSDQSPGEAALGKAISTGLSSLTAVERTDLDREIDSQPWVLRPILRAMAEDYAGLMRRAADAMPRVLFVLIPALAAILAVFYRGRHYPEHLYFATHFGAFVFVVLTLESLAAYTLSIPVIATAQVAAAVIIACYGVVAQRRVYGGSWPATGAKALGITTIYGVLWSSVVFGVTLFVSSTR